MHLRALFYRCGLLQSTRLTKPVIVVGNLTVGGNGKSPMVAWLVHNLLRKGYKPGIVSRGYGGCLNKQATAVTATHTAADVGDEALMLFQQTAVPVVVGVERAKAAQLLIDQCDCDVVISDDGLQHLAMQRDIELIMIDAQRQFGNGLCLPAGPLRESTYRLNSTPWQVYTNGDSQRYRLDLEPSKLYVHGHPEQVLPLRSLHGKTVHAVAAIGHPQRFFDTLRALGADVIEHAKPDHDVVGLDDVSFADDVAVVMTEKDAVKCPAVAGERVWVLAVAPKANAVLEQDLNDALGQLLAE